MGEFRPPFFAQSLVYWFCILTGYKWAFLSLDENRPKSLNFFIHEVETTSDHLR
jgi:hypothetical protein